MRIVKWFKRIKHGSYVNSIPTKESGINEDLLELCRISIELSTYIISENAHQRTLSSLHYKFKSTNKDNIHSTIQASVVMLEELHVYKEALHNLILLLNQENYNAIEINKIHNYSHENTMHLYYHDIIFNLYDKYKSKIF